MIKPNSSQIAGYDYDPATKTLTVEFKSGGTYTYHDVPAEKFEAMQAAPSVGSYLHANIKGKHEHRAAPKAEAAHA